MVNAVICGACGKMGKNIAEIINSRDDIEVLGGIDALKSDDIKFELVKNPNELSKKPDVIIDFSNPACLDMLYDYAKANNVPVVFGTTGYSDSQKDKIFNLSKYVPVFFTFNMSLGINLLCALAKKAAKVLGGRFDIEILEKHHNQKIDAPSGTALMLGDAINKELGNKYHYVYDRQSRREKRDPYEIGMSSIRGGTIVGEHDVIFAGNDEVITLSHSAGSKKVFAEGAVNAAVYLSGRPAGLYDMTKLLGNVLD